MFESIFQALFTYRPVVFQQGEFRFNISTGSLVAAGLVAAVMIVAIVTYRTVRGKGRVRDRVVLTGAAHGRAGARPLLPAASDAGRPRRRSAAERRRRAAGRLAQHADSRLEGAGARRVRPAGIRRRRSSADEVALRSLPRPHVPLFVDRRPPQLGERPEVRRLADAAGQRPPGRARRAGRPAGRRRRAGVGRRRHERCVAGGGAARHEGREAAGLHGRRRQPRRFRATFRSIASARRARC